MNRVQCSAFRFGYDFFSAPQNQGGYLNQLPMFAISAQP
jgi:hypothetical protein